jgi:hypothetical protein
MIAEEIKKIKEDIHLISTGKRIEVVAYTKNEIEEEKKEQKKLLERLKKKPLE